MTVGPNLKFISFYLIIFYVLAGMGVLLLNNYKNTHYTPKLLEEMIATPSRLRDITDNPCQYTLFGDPTEAGSHYVKINFICASGQKTVSTLSLKAVPDARLNTILSEYARLLGFDVHLLDNWNCLVEDKKFPDRNQIVPDKSQILCSFSHAKT